MLCNIKQWLQGPAESQMRSLNIEKGRALIIWSSKSGDYRQKFVNNIGMKGANKFY